ncbi:hypothetical protein IQ265_06525 [Nodosilinea sp. LEGE 06152]|uniref:hypothetical protein n=1 Tax=Nodosilinea sp. LEGE 06152 TaxID=2777966 RepID=UPI0018825234|nr:hypothetical protein [Nodosilinea sp. LEGE 06152]MBE9156484.1 hypothetical protein [Nodosilinea sp. LEGE 06152]
MSNEGFKLKPNDAFITARDFYIEISGIHQIVTHREKPVTRSTFYTWLDALKIKRWPTGQRGSYRGYEFNQVVRFLESMLRNGSIKKSVQHVQELIESGELTDKG